MESPFEPGRFTLPQAGKRWTDSGKFHDERGVKNRPRGETQVVPLPHLVTMWREHVATFGTADDGRLFFTEQGRIITYSTYNRGWHETRELALLPALTSTPGRRSPSEGQRSTVGETRGAEEGRFKGRASV